MSVSCGLLRRDRRREATASTAPVKPRARARTRAADRRRETIVAANS